jgi:transcription antitermination protein NusB
LVKRRKSRESALQYLYQREVVPQESWKGLAYFKKHFLLSEEDDAFLDRVVQGVLDHGQEIDQLIERYSEHWRLDRIALIDRTLLRIAIFELLYCEDIPPKATLNEAVDLAKQYGSENSGSFVNGILDRILSEVAHKSGQPGSMKP